MVSRVVPQRELSRTAAIVGVGNTDYGADYKALRNKATAGDVRPLLGLAAHAFERALADSGLERADIDGLIACVDYGAVDPVALSVELGIAPRFTDRGYGAMMVDVVPRATVALARGECNTVALVYAVSSRSSGRQFGGSSGSHGDGRHSYYYYHPWGWSSQAAHWALMFSYYQSAYGATEADLGSVAVTLRKAAGDNPDAIMRTPITIEDYLASRYIVRPLHLLDICLVNDGGVCIILQRSDRAKDRPHTPVAVAGWADTEVQGHKLPVMVRDRLRPQLSAAGEKMLDMAQMSLSDIEHFQGYDAATIHLVNQVEGYGFVEPGQGLEFCKAGEMDLGGRLPVNTSGGMLSEAYMHGWNLAVEAVRQLRHECGVRQVVGVETSMLSVATTESAHPLLLVRGA